MIMRQVVNLTHGVTGCSLYARSTEFDLARLEDRLGVSAQVPHRHEFYQIVWITHGAGAYIIDSESYPIEDNVVFMLSPGRMHYWETSQQSRGYVINFSTDLLHLVLPIKGSAPWFMMLNDWTICPAFYLNSDHSVRLLDTVARLEREHSGNELCRLDAIRAYLQIFLIQLHRCRPYPHQHHGSARSLALVEQFRLLIENHFSSKKPIREYASLLHVTEGHLNDTVKTITGKTARQLVHERILLEAKRLLTHGNTSISEVAYQLNFRDTAYFSRFFKKHTHQSPSEFKEMFENKYGAWGKLRLKTYRTS